jgi:hypothetical protein
MQYILCPRCQFKVPATKHMCQTCGYNLPSVAATGGGTSPERGKLSNPFAKMLGMNNSSKQQETTQEKPALS